jgi:hypothetical protein
MKICKELIINKLSQDNILCHFNEFDNLIHVLLNESEFKLFNLLPYQNLNDQKNTLEEKKKKEYNLFAEINDDDRKREIIQRMINLFDVRKIQK